MHSESKASKLEVKKTVFDFVVFKIVLPYACYIVGGGPSSRALYFSVLVSRWYV